MPIRTKPKFQVPQILFRHEDTENSILIYKLIIIHGIPFYQSSGNNSGFANTWFPFLGVTCIGKSFHITKPSRCTSSEIFDTIRKYFPNDAYGSCRGKNSDLPVRFGSLSCLLVSSILDGGLWEKPKGQKLKNELIDLYPEFYSSYSKFNLQFSPPSFFIETADAANNWIMTNTQVKDLPDLKARLEMNWDALVSVDNPNNMRKLLEMSPSANTPTFAPLYALTQNNNNNTPNETLELNESDNNEVKIKFELTF